MFRSRCGFRRKVVFLTSQSSLFCYFHVLFSCVATCFLRFPDSVAFPSLSLLSRYLHNFYSIPSTSSFLKERPFRSVLRVRRGQTAPASSSLMRGSMHSTAIAIVEFYILSSVRCPAFSHIHADTMQILWLLVVCPYLFIFGIHVDTLSPSFVVLSMGLQFSYLIFLVCIYVGISKN